VAAIAGTVIGSLVFLASTITLVLFFLRKKLDSQTSGKVRRSSRALECEIDLSSDSRQTPAVTPYGLAPRPYSNTSFDANPFQDPPSHPTSSGTFQSPSQRYPLESSEGPIIDSSLPYLSESIPPQSASSTSTSQRKAAMAGVKPYKPSRYVVHTDAEDLPQPNHDGVIELPPQYSERRRILGVANPTPDSSGNLSS
jgi:hypothetical protein